MAMTTTQAPSVNLETRKITVATAVTNAPVPLITARLAQPCSRVRRQCTTRPDWERVKPMNTPIANKGIRVLVFPPTATSSAAEKMVSAQTPLPKTRRRHGIRREWGR